MVFSTLKWPILQTIPPRLAYIAFNFSQTFLIEAAIEILGQSSEARVKEHTYGLIGAAALVYTGLAVSFIYRLEIKIRADLS